MTVGVSEESQSPCHCQVFAPSDYQTMIISTIGEIARKYLSVLGGSLFWVGDVQLRVSEERRVTCHTLDSCLVEMDESPNHAEVSPVRSV